MLPEDVFTGTSVPMGSKVASGSMLEEASTTKAPFVVLGIGDMMASTGGVAVAIGLKGS